MFLGARHPALPLYLAPPCPVTIHLPPHPPARPHPLHNTARSCHRLNTVNFPTRVLRYTLTYCQSPARGRTHPPHAPARPLHLSPLRVRLRRTPPRTRPVA
jgi:hypothetical protein